MLRYLSGTKDVGLVFKKSKDLNVVAYGDANYDTKRSQTGIVVMVGGNTVTWRSCKQASTATSSADSEVQAMQLTAVLGELVKLLMESVLQRAGHIDLKCDNQAAITQTKGECSWKPKNLIN